MQKGAVLINVGRGGIVNEADLAEAIDQNGIYAGIDVTALSPWKRVIHSYM
jgi:phosphoglycerate dehydrogenase-like enzyme